jgi:hypothetical protein
MGAFSTKRNPRCRLWRYRLFAMPSCNVEATLRTHVEFAQAALERQRGLRCSTQTPAHGDLHAAELVWRGHKSVCLLRKGSVPDISPRHFGE